MEFRSALASAIELLQYSHKVQSDLSERGVSSYLFDDIPDRLLDAMGVPRDNLPPLSDAGDSDETAFVEGVHFSRDYLRDAFSEQSAEQFLSLVIESVARDLPSTAKD